MVLNEIAAQAIEGDAIDTDVFVIEQELRQHIETSQAQLQGTRPAYAYQSVGDFVCQYLAHHYARQIFDQHEVTWCPQWWRHPEAVDRLTALWAAYEELHADGYDERRDRQGPDRDRSLSRER